MTVNSRYEVRLSEREVRRLCNHSRDQSLQRRHEYEQRPGLGWGIGLWAFILLGSLAFWGVVVSVIVKAVS